MKLKFGFEKTELRSEPQEDREELVAAEPSTDSFSEDETIAGLSELYVPEETSESHVRDVADVLLELGKISTEQEAEVRQEQSSRPGSDAAVLLLKAGVCSAEDVLTAKAELCGLEFRHVTAQDVDKEAFEKLDIDFIRSSSICPIAMEEGTLVVATSEPTNVFAMEDVKRQTGMELRPVVCRQEDIEAVCEALNEGEPVDGSLDDIISDMSDVEVVQDEQDETEDLEKMAGQSPVIKFVNYLISNAIHEGASDIHIEPRDKFTKIRYRIDGVLLKRSSLR